MKTKVICLISLISILLFSGCTGNRASDLNQSGVSSEISNTGTSDDGSIFSVRLPGWNMYKGNCVITDCEDLPYLEEYVLDGDVLTVYGDAYILLDPPTDTIMLPTTSGWKIDLNAMCAKWRTAEGDIVLLPDDDNPPVICIYEQESDQIRSYLQQELVDKGIASLGIDSFEVYYKDGAIPINKQLEKVWGYYTSDNGLQPATPLLDGDWSYHTLSLVYNSCAALQHEINFTVCEGFLYLENCNSGELMRVSVSEII